MKIMNDRDELPVLPSQLVSMRTATFIKDVLEPYRSHLAVSWSAEKVDEVENEQRSMRVSYESDAATRKAIDSTGNKPHLMRHGIRFRLDSAICAHFAAA